MSIGHIGFPEYLNVFKVCNCSPTSIFLDYFSNFYIFIVYNPDEEITLKIVNPSSIVDPIYILAYGGGAAGNSVDAVSGGVAPGGGGGSVYYGAIALYQNFLDDGGKIKIKVGDGGKANDNSLNGNNGEDTILTFNDIYTLTCGGGQVGTGMYGGPGGIVENNVPYITPTNYIYPPLNSNNRCAYGATASINGIPYQAQNGYMIFTPVAQFCMGGGGGSSCIDINNITNDVVISGSGGYGAGNGANLFGMTSNTGCSALNLQGAGGGGAISLTNPNGNTGTYIKGGDGSCGLAMILIPYPPRIILPFQTNENTNYYVTDTTINIIFTTNTSLDKITFTNNCSIKVILMGGGGSGGNGYLSSNNTCSGGQGGQAGEFISILLNITANDVIGYGSSNTFSIGEGGIANPTLSTLDSPAQDGNSGSNTTLIYNSITYTALGGLGGKAGIDGENIVNYGNSKYSAGVYNTYENQSIASSSSGYTYLTTITNTNTFYNCDGQGGTNGDIPAGTFVIGSGMGGTNTTNGSDATGYSSGGGGGGSISNATIDSIGLKGGNGKSGMIIIQYDYK